MDNDFTIFEEHRHDFSYDVGGSLCDTWPDALRAYVENCIYGKEAADPDDDAEQIVDRHIELYPEEPLLMTVLSPKYYAVRIGRDELVEAVREYLGADIKQTGGEK